MERLMNIVRAFRPTRRRKKNPGRQHHAESLPELHKKHPKAAEQVAYGGLRYAGIQNGILQEHVCAALFYVAVQLVGVPLQLQQICVVSPMAHQTMRARLKTPDTPFEYTTSRPNTF